MYVISLVSIALHFLTVGKLVCSVCVNCIRFLLLQCSLIQSAYSVCKERFLIHLYSELPHKNESLQFSPFF